MCILALFVDSFWHLIKRLDPQMCHVRLNIHIANYVMISLRVNNSVVLHERVTCVVSCFVNTKMDRAEATFSVSILTDTLNSDTITIATKADMLYRVPTRSNKQIRFHCLQNDLSKRLDL